MMLDEFMVEKYWLGKDVNPYVREACKGAQEGQVRNQSPWYLKKTA
jgi:hypothetical protein